MSSPFVFGKTASAGSFLNRKKEIAHLETNFLSGINTMLISPRRWGKSSLIKKAAEQFSLKHKNYRFCFIDLFEINNEQEFYQSLMQEVIKSGSSKWEEWMHDAKTFLKSIVTSFSIGTDPYSDFQLKLSWDNPEENAKTIINLPEKLAEKKNIRFVICIDEFQKIATFANPLLLQQKLRANWQHHRNTSYCLYGSKRHVITELFTSESMPLFKFGDIIFLDKIEKKYWVKFITESFKKTGKTISKPVVKSIIETAGNHPYHVQQIAHHVWRFAGESVDEEVFTSAVEELLRYHEIMFSREIEDMSELQINFLSALVNKEKNLNSKETIEKYKLGTPGNTGRIKQALENKEIVDFYGQVPEFINPLFELWFKRRIKRIGF